MRVRDDAGVGRMRGDEVEDSLYQIQRARVSHIRLNFRRLITHCAPSQKLALHKCSARACHLVEHEFTGRRISKDEVSRDVGRPVAAVVADVSAPVAAVGEAPDGGGFGGEGGGGEGGGGEVGEVLAFFKRIYTALTS